MKAKRTFQLLVVALFSVSILFVNHVNAQSDDDKKYGDLERPKNIGVSNFDNFKNSSFDVYYNVGKLDVNLGKVEENLINYKKDPGNIDAKSLKADVKALKEINETVPNLKSELKELSGKGKTLVKEAKNVKPRTKAPKAAKNTKKSITALDKAKERMGTLVERQKVALTTAKELLGEN